MSTFKKTLLAAGTASLLALTPALAGQALAGQSVHTGHTMPAHTMPAPAKPAQTKATPAKATPVRAPLPLSVQGATVAAVPPSIKDTAAYMTLTNTGAQPIKLVGAGAPLAAHSMLMTTTRSGGMMGMKMVSSLTIPARSKLTLHRSGDHLMLTGLRRPLKVGETVTLTLTAEDGRTLNVGATVKKN